MGDAIKGCSYWGETGELRRCGWFNGTRCTHEDGAILTSTLPGAHPADCPLILEEDDGK